MVLASLVVAATARADCRTAPELAALARSVASAFNCERARLTRGGSCAPSPAPACAGAVVGKLVALGGTTALDGPLGDRSVLGRALRCQRAIGRGIARAAVSRVGSAAAGMPGRRADARAAPFLRRIDALCAVDVVPTAGGLALPRAGAPCDALSAPGGRVEPSALVSCLRRRVGELLEPALRSSIKPSIVLIVTDDQPASMLGRMDTLQTDLVADRGVVFTHASASTPLCSPARASIFTGRYAHAHGVQTNYFAFERFDDSSTIATWLHDAGYRTGLVGKYLNGYGGQGPTPEYAGPLPYVPPGWDVWHAYAGGTFFNYRLADNTTIRSYGAAEADYATDVLAEKAVDFIRQAGDQPFLLVFAPYAPHDPATPAPRHAGRFAGLPPWRPLSWNEADVTDKARWLRELTPPLTSYWSTFADALYPKMVESLLAVDEAIGAIMQTLRQTGRADDTLVVYTSDNGLALGEHRYVGKLCPYEECLRVPFVVRYPRFGVTASLEERPVAHIDLAPTFAELAGIAPPRTVDGRSLAPLLDGSVPEWRTDILAEQWSFARPPYRAVRTARWSYIEYGVIPPLQSPEAELFDLAADPQQLTSVALDPAYDAVKRELAARVRVLDPGWKQPAP